MSPIVNYTITRKGREMIGDSVAIAMNQIALDTGRTPTVVAVVPRVLQNSYALLVPVGLEVIEVDVLVEVE